MNMPLDGYRVLDLSQGAAGPVCTAILADYGADVIKLEPPGGDWGRRLGPPFYTVPGTGGEQPADKAPAAATAVPSDAAAFAAMNRNKRSLVVDLKRPEGQSLVRRLCREVDVLVEAFRPEVMRRLGLDYQTAAAQNPGLIYCSVSAFGATGPWRNRPGVDGIVQGISGLMSITGTEDGPPVKVSVAAGDVTAGLLASQAVVMALLERQRSGKGQQVSLSLLQSLLFFQIIPLSMFLAGESVRRTGSAAPYAAPNEAFATRDGHLMVAAYQPDTWPRFCQALGLAELAGDPRFADNASRVRNRRELRRLLGARLAERSTAAWLAVLEEADIPCGPILTYDEVLATPATGAREWLATVAHPAYGDLRLPGLPFHLHRTPGAVRQPPPLAGQHTRSVLREFGLTADEVRVLEQDRVIWQHPGGGAGVGGRIK